MSDFSFTATAECDRCGNYLSSSDEDCTECVDKDLHRYHFTHLTEDRVETVWSIDPIRAWHDVMKEVDEPLPWRCVETGDMTLDVRQMGIDVRELC